MMYCICPSCKKRITLTTDLTNPSIRPKTLDGKIAAINQKTEMLTTSAHNTLARLIVLKEKQTQKGEKNELRRI